MDFDFTPEQYALRDLARELFDKESPPSRLRELYEGAEPASSCWRAMAAAGLTGITVPEEYGGAGGDEIDLALVLEEAGRAALPDPFVETVAIAAPLIAESGTPEQRAEWLPRIASGEATVSVRLRGDRYAVAAGETDLLVVEVGNGFVVLAAGSFDAERVESEDRSRRLYLVELPSAPEIGDGAMPSADAAASERAAARGALSAAGVLNGVATRLLDMTVAHVKARQQFGRAVGSFQAVKHRLVDAHVAVEQARAATWHAAYALANGLAGATVAASVAKAQASEAEALANTAALQLHGGIGFTWEHDLHLWLKRGKALEQSYGNATQHRRRIAEHVFETSAAGE